MGLQPRLVRLRLGLYVCFCFGTLGLQLLDLFAQCLRLGAVPTIANGKSGKLSIGGNHLLRQLSVPLSEGHQMVFTVHPVRLVLIKKR